MKITTTFYHDDNFKKEFNLFEMLIVKNIKVDLVANKIKIGDHRVRKFNRGTTISGHLQTKVYGSFTVNKVKYYFKHIENANK